MAIFQMDLTRILQVYIVQGIFFAFFLFIAYKILRRDTKRLNIIFSAFYLCIAIGLFINFIYAPINIESIVIVLYYLTLFFLLFGNIFFLIFNLLLLKSEKIMNTKMQILIIGVYAILLFCMVLIPEGVTINESTGWRPVYSPVFLLYVIVILTGIPVGPGLYFANKIYKKFQDEKLRKKWRCYIIGLIGLYAFAYGTLISNTLNNQTFRIVWGIISLGLIIFFPYLVYYGVIRQIEK